MRGIYAITNILTDTVYYGQSINIEGRLRSHKSDLNKNKHGNPRLQNSWNKYGNSAFVFAPYRIFENGEDITSLEKKYINEAYSLGLITFNMSDPTDPTVWTAESREKIAIYRRGKLTSEETKRKISEAMTGIKRSSETKKKHSHIMIGNKNGVGNKNRLGKTFTQETKQKMSQSHKGNKSRTGMKNSEASKQKQSIFMKGNKYAKK